MKVAEWREVHLAVLEGIEAHLCRSAPRKAHRLLADHRAQARAARSASERREIDVAINRLVHGASHFRAAWRRFVLTSVFQGIDTLATLQEQLGGSKGKCRRIRRAAAAVLKKIRGGSRRSDPTSPLPRPRWRG